MIAKLDRLDEFVTSTTPAIRFAQPVLCLHTVRAALNLQTEDVVALIESGELRWAWNLAASPSIHDRGIRVLARSLANYQHRTRPPRTSEDDEFRAVMRLILPSVKHAPDTVATIRQCELARQLVVDAQLLAKLLANGEFQLARAAKAATGRYGSPEVTVASVEAFLTRRRIA